MVRADGRTGDGALILVAGENEEQEGCKLHTRTIQALEVNIAIGGSGILVIGVYRNPESTSAQDCELFLILSGVAGPAGKLFMLGDFDAPEIGWLCNAALSASTPAR